MYLTGVIVTLVAAVAADVQPLQPLGTSNQGTSQSTALLPLGGGDDGKTFQMSEFCFFNKYPSATCRFRCNLTNMEAYCIDGDSGVNQSGEGKCACRPEEISDEARPEAGVDIFAKPETHKEQEEEKKKKPEEGQKTPEKDATSHEPTYTIPIHTATEETEEEPTNKQHHVVFYVFDLNKIFGPATNDTKSEGAQAEVPEPQAAPAGWAFQHFIAILIIVLLFVLIAIELFACYKKQRAKNHDMDTIFKNMPMPNKA